MAATAADGYPSFGTVERLDPTLDQIIAKEAVVEKLCEGFNWAEGPTWKDGALLFSDVPANVIYQWKPGMTTAEDFLRPSGMLKPTPGFREQGSNGLTVDASGHLVICAHGERRVARLGDDRQQTALTDHYDGQRYNSPNDLAFRRNGDLYFTDPPYGLEGLNDSKLKEMNFNGVFRVKPNGETTLLTRELTFPNGIAFSPDEKTLYVGVTDPAAPRIAAFPVRQDGTLGAERLFFDAKPLAEKGLNGSCDGLKVDAAGNVFSSGPGGLLILSPEGKLLGSIKTGTLIANCAWGDDGGTLYFTAHHALGRIRTLTHGAHFPLTGAAPTKP